jgi:F-type H+-transporting ATPase subunit epsilon
MASINIVVVTPEATVVDAQTTFVALPFYDGELGIGLNHAPLIGRLGVGELRFQEGGKIHQFYVDGGFVQIADNVVSVMADKAMPVSKIAAEDARRLLEKTLLTKAVGSAQIEKRDKEATQARSMLRLVERH